MLTRTEKKIEQIKDRLANDNVDADLRDDLIATLAYLEQIQS